MVMNSFRLSVAPLGEDWIAECNEPRIRSLGGTAVAAVQNARKMLYSIVEPYLRPTMLLVTIKDLWRSTIVMQPLADPIALESSAAKPSWRYIATVETKPTL